MSSSYYGRCSQSNKARRLPLSRVFLSTGIGGDMPHACVTIQICPELRRFYTLHEGQEGGLRALQDGQPHLSPWEFDGANPPRNSFQTYKEQEAVQSVVSMVYEGKLTPDQASILI